jgi:S-adenosylmethionine hydrolase
MRPVVALLTDFGVRDHYAGTMKGVVLGICPDATLVDISHDVPPHDVLSAALELAASYRYFPAGTVFLVVVDPGVVFKEAPPRRVAELTERRFARPTVSRTFEGRDRFAPAAGWLAKGTEVKALGRTLTDYVRLAIPDPVVTEHAVRGEVLRVDRFGNLITNIDRRSVERLGRPGEATVEILAGDHRVGRLVTTYAEITPGEVCSLFGSTEHLEVAANASSAAETLGLGRGATVSVTRVDL